jgi:formamidopyrimidine-DNA glycosylase
VRLVGDVEDDDTAIDIGRIGTVGALRVLAGSGNTNLAEVELVRSVVDTTAVRLYLDETAELRAEDWKRPGWVRLTEAREAAAAVVGDGADPTQEDADAAADALAEAVAALKPARGPGHGHPGRPTRPA